MSSLLRAAPLLLIAMTLEAQTPHGTMASSSAASVTATTAAASLTLTPGDAVRLSVWRAPELNGEFVVAPNGTLAHPAFPGLFVAGLPLSRVQAMLDSAARLENVGAQVIMQPLLHVVIDGEVRSPNLYRYPAGTSIAEALAMSGGRTERANSHRLQLVRRGQSTWFDLTDPGGPATRSPIESGDQLLLPRARRSFVDAATPYLSFVAAAASIAVLTLRR